MYTITFANLDVDEADHISQILNDYLCDNLERRIKADNQGEENLVSFYDAHLEWHKKVMKKMQWERDKE